MRRMNLPNEDLPELEKAKAHNTTSLIEYIPNAVMSKTLFRKPTGNVTLMAFDTGEELTDKISPFDTFIQILDGTAEIMINNSTHQLSLGHCIIVPAHASHYIYASEPFKMLSTVIKSGYEE